MSLQHIIPRKPRKRYKEERMHPGDHRSECGLCICQMPRVNVVFAYAGCQK